MLTQFYASRRILFILALLHILIIALSNYLVQKPVDILGFKTTWGAFTFPFIFLLTDLTVRIYGKGAARKIIFIAMLPALVISYYFSLVFLDGQFIGHGELMNVNAFVLRIVIASFSAYVIGQLLDIYIFDRLRQINAWWIAPICSTFFGGAIDTFCFFSIAFYKSSDAYMAMHWGEIAILDYLFKIVISVLFLIPLYGVLITKLIDYLQPRFRLTSESRDS